MSQSRKLKKIKTNRYERNHKTPLPAYYENPRYTGACTINNGKCSYCTGGVK